MANKPLDKGYLLTQFKNFFNEKIKGAFVPSENLTSTTTVVAKDLDVTATEGSVDLVGPRVTANGSDILTENLFPHNLLARYIGIMISSNREDVRCNLEKRMNSGANYLVPYVYGSFTSAPPKGYISFWVTHSINAFVAPYTGTFYLGMFKNDGDSTYVTARRYIDVILNDNTDNTSVVIMSRNSDYDKLGVDISLTQGHKYEVELRIYNGFNVPSDTRFYVYPSLYTHTVDNFDYKKFYSILLSINDDIEYENLPTYRGINQLTDLYDMINTLSKKIENVTVQNKKAVYISSDSSTASSYVGKLHVTRENSWLRLNTNTDYEDITHLVSIKGTQDYDECQLTFLVAATWGGIRFRLLDYYGGSESKIVAYDGDGDKTWNTLSDKQTGWQLIIATEDDVDSLGFKLQLYGVNSREYTKLNSTDKIYVTVTQIDTY